ncbi:MAG: branched-chain amino acid ABC transporter ATP-binding protein [Thermoprotei archaeon]|nr:MAG: branched-chain amino acid ABC transporter ATP-binding protein [Thermoprotei archaeon]
MLKLENIEAGYGEFRVLHGVNMVVNREEIVALVGPNGAGKTTTLRTILGMTTLYGGKVYLEGKDLTGIPTHKRVELGITMVPEGRGIFNPLTVEENLLAGAYTKRGEEKLQESLEFVYTLFPRLKERRMQRAGTLSGGEAQMLAIGRALMARPEILLLDEPSLGLAPKLVLEVFDTVVKLRNEANMTILLVEQHVKNSLEIADKAYVMEMGRIVLEGGGKALLEDERLKKAYLAL